MTFAFSRVLRRLAPAIALLGAFAVPTPAVAQGDLLIAPTRVILDGRRGTEVILSNVGTEEATYRIGLELRRMDANGQLVEVDASTVNPDEQAALEMIRYAPRRITLPPGQPQAVRIAARPDAALADGEYRVHMSFKAIPKARPVSAEEATVTDGVSIRLIPVYGVSIPIIVRHGRLDAQVAINQPRLVEGARGPELVMTLSRQGDSSTYGEVRVVKPGTAEPIVMARGIAVYPEVTEREVRLPLTPEQAASLTGQLRFEYRDMPEAGGGLMASVDTVLG